MNTKMKIYYSNYDNIDALNCYDTWSNIVMIYKNMKIIVFTWNIPLKIDSSIDYQIICFLNVIRDIGYNSIIT